MKPPSRASADPRTPRNGERSADPLVQQAVDYWKGGDRSGVHYLYARFASEVFRQAELILRDRDAAEAVTQSVFLDMDVGKWQPAAEDFERWILRRARRAAVGRVGRPPSLPNARLSERGDGRTPPAKDPSPFEEASTASRPSNRMS